ncbi:aspartate/glutamate racemase family protein [Hoeflea sp.]|uniref:aspartate/glutamate racemase family protein n=1 Tax=Hoeflea sp. TaxID=1940281 RepID=UPI0019B64236|nr:aspartate/glutamate racemase family protein [Hoeflea sp.]MBC7283409.1 Asp/Glu/hydantoin racemase [Hoeflea sp.]
MRLLLINPNTTRDLTDRLVASAVRVLPSDVELLTATASTGFSYISSRAEAQIAAVGVLEVLAEQTRSIDAAIIAAFGDPGLHAARELFDLPVTGMSEAAMIMSLSLGERFAFVTFSPRLGPWYAEQVARAGLSARFAGIFTPEEMFGSIASVAEDLRSPLLRVCLRAASEADVVILAGAPIAGLAADIAGEVPAILIDPIQAAVLQAVALCRLAPKGADSGSFARPPGKDSTGLPDALASWIARRP